MVELPHLLRIMMGADTNVRSIVPQGDNFLVDKEEEQLVIHAWRRRTDEGSSKASDLTPPPLTSLEQLLWYDTMAALAETKPCGEERVPMARFRLEDEGIGTLEELLGDGLDSRTTGVPDDDRP